MYMHDFSNRCCGGEKKKKHIAENLGPLHHINLLFVRPLFKLSFFFFYHHPEIVSWVRSGSKKKMK